MKGFQKGHKINVGKKNHFGFKHSKEIREKLRQYSTFGITGMKGRKHSEETKNKMRISQLGKHVGNKGGNWKGGLSYERYPIDWTQTLRRSIRERDRYTCKLCGDLQGDRTLDVHHIDYEKKNCNPYNLITLCRKCNIRVNSKRNYWTQYFQKIMLNK